MGPPSSGGSTVGEALNILEAFDLSAPDRALAL
jgi:gamma-glutamyltranspeptidase/glutathione hydrolase